MASSLQPCIAPGTTDVQAPLEAHGRGFTHGHGKGHRLTPFIITFGVDADFDIRVACWSNVFVFFKLSDKK